MKVSLKRVAIFSLAVGLVGVGWVLGFISVKIDQSETGKSNNLVEEIVMGELGEDFEKRIPEMVGRNPEKVSEFLMNLKYVLNKGDAKSLSKMVSYPLNVGTKEGTVIIETESDMIDAFPIIFTVNWRLKIIKIF